MSESPRRRFLKTAGVAGAALAAVPAALRAASEGGDPVVLAFVGVGYIHTPGFVKLLNGREDVRVKWVWDHDAERAKVRAANLGARVAASVEEAVDDPEVQAVVICSETDRHPALVAAAARARKPVFVEKPLGTTVEGSLEMAAAIERASVAFTTGYFMRTDPKHLFLKAEVGTGSSGTITRAQAWNVHGGSLGGAPPTS